MASLTKLGNSWRIQFMNAHGKRQSVRIGAMTARQADGVKLRVEALVAAKISGTPIDTETARWVAGLGDKLADRLARVGLVTARKSESLGGMIDTYIAQRGNLKPGSRANLGYTGNLLKDHFGPGKPVREITARDADAFAHHVRNDYGYKSATAAKTVRRSRQFFNAAVRWGLIEANPFAGVVAGSELDPTRQHYVSDEDAKKLLDATPDKSMRLLIALSRFAGVRIPSEVAGMTWADIDWAQQRFLVRSPKTEKNKGRATRWVPIFPQLLPHFESAYEVAPEGTLGVFPPARTSKSSLRSRLTTIIERAGLTVWPKPWHNMRASCQTDLVKVHPLHVVCAWLGNSPAVAARHYLQTTDADFERATGVQKEAQHTRAHGRTDRQPQGAGLQDSSDVRDDALACAGSAGEPNYPVMIASLVGFRLGLGIGRRFAFLFGDSLAEPLKLFG